MRWTNTTSPPGDLGLTGVAFSASSNGGIVVGSGGGAGAFLWGTTGGLRFISDVLTALNATPSGWTVTSVLDVSDNGSILVGYGTRNGTEARF